MKKPLPTLDVANPLSSFVGYQDPVISLPTQDFDGDIVSIIRCSDSPRQLWSLGPSNEVKHIDTDKCLSVEENIYSTTQDSVTVNDCNSKGNDAQRWFLNRPN